MKKFINFLLLLTILTGQSYNARSQSAKLSGNWLCRSEYGSVSLNFLSNKLLEYDGERYQYTVSGNTLNVYTEDGLVQYPFQLDGTQLIIAFPEGYSLLFNKIKKSSAGQNTGPAASPGGRFLKGTLCEYGSSSSYSSYSSYSHTNWVYFDGNGHFQYGSESSYSGSAGGAYGSDSDPANRGTYKISGNNVYLTFQDGTSVTLTVHFVQDNGHITELMYGEKLYAAGLCD